MIPILERLDAKREWWLAQEAYIDKSRGAEEFGDELEESYEALRAIIVEAVEALEANTCGEDVSVDPDNIPACCRAYNALERIKELGA